MIDAFLTQLNSLPSIYLLSAGCTVLGALVCFCVLEIRTNRWKRKYQALTLVNSRLEERLTLEQRHAQEKDTLIENSRKEMQLQFKDLAQHILEEKSRNLSSQSSEKLDSLLQPFREQINSFRDRIDTIFLEETRERSSLKQEIMHLRELNQQINQEAKNLTDAITGSKKVQGTWGEMVLERLLEQTGLREGHEYSAQAGLRNRENRLQKPDIIVHLPDSKDIIIDSKVSLSAWSRYVTAENENERSLAMTEHIQALRNHISDLNGKNYSSLPELKTLEFVLMFVPIDAAFVAALQCEDKLMAEMYSNRIIIVTPTTLLATLKTVEHIWQLERQNQNALEIAGKAGQLYDKLCSFLEDMEKLGKQLDTCRDSYDKAMNKMSRGRGNLISQAGAFPKLGVQTKKNISRSLLETAEKN